MKKSDLDTTAAGLAFINAGNVPVLDVMSDPSALALGGLKNSDKKELDLSEENADEDKEDERKR